MHKTKILLCSVLFQALVLTQNSFALAGETLLKLNDIIQNIELSNNDGNTFISINDASKIFDFNYTIDYSASNYLTIKKDDLTLKIFKDQNYVDLNDERLYYLNAPMYIEKNIVMLPLRGLCKCFGIDLKWDANTKTISIDILNDGSEKKDIVPEKKDDDKNIIAYDDALKKAIKNNSSLKNLDDNLEYLEDAREKTLETYNDMNLNINAPLEQITATLTQMSSLYQNIKSMENQLASRSLNETLLKDSVEYTLRNYLANIETAKINIQMQNEQLNLKQKEIQNIKLKNDLGMAGDFDLQAAENSYEQEKLNLVALQTNLDSTKNLLNKLIGDSADNNYEINFEPTDKLFDEDIEYYIISESALSPDIILKKKALDLAEYILNAHDDLTDDLESEKVNNVAKASRELEDAKSQLATNIKVAYNNLKNLEDTHKNLQLELQKAKDNYNKLVISYKNGMVSKFDLDSAKLQLAQIEANIKKNDYQRDLLIFTLEKPYLIINQGA